MDTPQSSTAPTTRRTMLGVGTDSTSRDRPSCMTAYSEPRQVDRFRYQSPASRSGQSSRADTNSYRTEDRSPECSCRQSSPQDQKYSVIATARPQTTTQTSPPYRY